MAAVIKTPERGTVLPTLGVGLSYRSIYHADVFYHRGEVDFLEIIADHFFNPTRERQGELERLSRHFTLVPHGLNLSLGSADGLNTAYLEKLAAVIKHVNPPWWSEHIAFTHTAQIELGHLTPLPYTWEAVDVFCRNIETVRKYISAPLILENITNMIRIPGAEMSETEFIRAILERTDCGLLLDLTNLYTNAVNEKIEPVEMLDALPLDRVVQLHFAGGHWHRERLIDSHAYPTPEPVWELMKVLLEGNAPVRGAVLERDDNLPPFPELMRELEAARQLGKESGQWS